MTHQSPDASVPAPLSAEAFKRLAQTIHEEMSDHSLIGPCTGTHLMGYGGCQWIAAAVIRHAPTLDAERQARAADPREEGLREALATLRLSVRFVDRTTGDDLTTDDIAQALAAATPARAAAPAPDYELREAARELTDAIDQGREFTNKVLRVQRALRAAAEPAGLPLDAARYRSLLDRIVNWITTEDKQAAIAEARRVLASQATSQGTPEEEG